MFAGRCSRATGKNRFLAISLLVFAAVPVGCGVPGAYGPADTYGLDFSMPPDSQLSGAIVFFVDGVNASIFQEMIEAGELPAIKKYLADPGLYAPRAVANTPSVTLANMTSLVTGEFPGHHGVTGVNWFDRNQLLWRNYETIAQKNTLDGDYVPANLYEQFPDRSTFSVFFQPHRGTTKFIENWTSAGPPFYFGWYEFVDRLTLSRFDLVIDIARKRQEFPAVTVAYLLAPDFRAYGKGVKSKEYRDALRHTDRQIGRVCGDLERAGLLEKLHLVLVSDHSLGEVTRHFPLEKYLREQVGLNIARQRLWEQTPFEKRLEYYRQFPAVLYGSGDRYWAICLRKPRRVTTESADFAAWTVRPGPSELQDYPIHSEPSVLARLANVFFHVTWPPPQRKDLLSLLVEPEAVDALAYSVGADRVRVRRKGGEVEFRQDGGREGSISYHLIAGEDPLGWKGKVSVAALRGEPMDGREWLAATHDTQYPDLPAQILAYFRARRAGDIAMFAAPGWDFNTVNRAGHGGLRPEDLHVPILLAGPRVPHGRVQVARTVDVMPTLLELLGRPLPPGLDGRSLIPPPAE